MEHIHDFHVFYYFQDLDFVDDGEKDTTTKDPPFDPSQEELTRNLKKYPEFIIAALSCGLSNRKTAKLINALFKDEGIDAYVSPEKVRLLKQKRLQELNAKHKLENKGLIAIGVDGKNGMVKELHCQSSSQDKQSITNSVTGDYHDHFIPNESTGEKICEGIHKSLVEFQSTDTLLAVNMDGCRTNTGIHQGVIRHLEAKLERPLTWIICSLHCNELVFRHLFEAIGEFFLTWNQMQFGNKCLGML